MAGNYPPGVSAGTSNAPWNAEPPKDCPECGGVYTDDGHGTVGDSDEWLCHLCGEYFVLEDAEECPECGSEDFGGLPCPNDGMNGADYKQGQRAAEADRKYDAMREKEVFGK